MKILAEYARSILSVGFLFFGIAFGAFAGEWNAQHLGVVVATPDTRWKVEVDRLGAVSGQLSMADSEKKAHTRLIVSAVPSEVGLPQAVFNAAHHDAFMKSYTGNTSLQLVSQVSSDVLLNGGVQAKYVHYEFKNGLGALRSVGVLHCEAFVGGKKSYIIMFMSNFRLHEPLKVDNPDVVQLIKSLRVLDERLAGAGQPEQVAVAN